ncbi:MULTISPECIES: hypothetical protein, partial [Ruminococcus]|uniref:hypothetical protein n=1 Tax=Ruminococcus TaxID=1263 RepID=UPI000E809DA3
YHTLIFYAIFKCYKVLEINYVLMPLLLFTAGAFLLQICPNNLVFTNDKFHGIIEKEDLQQLQRRSIW